MTGLISRILGRQLSRPSGFLGKVVGHIMSSGNKGMYASALSVLDLRQGDVVLEIGFGNGAHIGGLLPNLLPGQYHGVEMSDTMLAEAKRTTRKVQPEGHVFLQLVQDEHLPFVPDRFDKVLTVNTIYFWNHPERMMQEIFRVLKPGGRIVVTFNTDEYLRTKPYARDVFRLVGAQEVNFLFQQSGFINIRSHYEILKHQDALSVYAEKP